MDAFIAINFLNTFGLRRNYASSYHIYGKFYHKFNK